MSPEATSIASLERPAQTNPLPAGEVRQTVQRFIEWLDGYGEVSYDFQSYFSSDLTRAAKAQAFLDNRGYVTPQDVKSIGYDVLRHRLSVTYEAEAEEITSEQLLQRIFDHLKVP